MFKVYRTNEFAIYNYCHTDQTTVKLRGFIYLFIIILKWGPKVWYCFSELQGFLVFAVCLMTQAGMGSTSLWKTLWLIFNGSNSLSTYASIEEISREENLTFCTLKLTCSISHFLLTFKCRPRNSAESWMLNIPDIEHLFCCLKYFQKSKTPVYFQFYMEKKNPRYSMWSQTFGLHCI